MIGAGVDWMHLHSAAICFTCTFCLYSLITCDFMRWSKRDPHIYNILIYIYIRLNSSRIVFYNSGYGWQSSNFKSDQQKPTSGLAHLDNISTIKYIKFQSPIFIFPIFFHCFPTKTWFSLLFSHMFAVFKPSKAMNFSLSQDLPRQRRRSDLRRGRPAEPRQHARRRRSDGRLGRRGRLRSAPATQGATGAAFPRALSRNQPGTLERCKDGGGFMEIFWGI